MSKIDKILENLTGIGKDCKPRMSIAQAKQSLLKEILKTMPKEKNEAINNHDEYHERYGYNQALQDCLTNLKELFK